MTFWEKPFEQLCSIGVRSPASLRVISLCKLTVSAVLLLFVGFWILLHYGSQVFSKSGPCKQTWPLREYVVLTPGCRILDLAPHEPSLLKFFSLDVSPGPILCRGRKRGELVKSTTTHLYVNIDAARNFTQGDFHCCYRPFRRMTARYNASGEYDLFVDYMNVYHKHCFPIFFHKDTLVLYQFVYVICKDSGEHDTNSTEARIIYEDYFTFAVDSTVEKREYEKNKITSTERSPDVVELEEGFAEEDDNEKPVPEFSVLMLGFDGMSRLNFVRQMPRTMAFFEENGGTTFFGFNKVGYNTFPNLVPILTGMNTNDLGKQCWPNKKSVYDDCPFIWKMFKENGYYTAYGEDNTFVSTFSYQARGFRRQPVDYYLKPFFVESEVNLRVTKLEPHTSILCVGNKPNLVRFENAVRGFVSNMKDRLTFGLFWFNGFSHDYLNLPRVEDKVFRSMLDKLKAEGALESTVLIGLSDHGIRWGDFRQTFQGFLEERLPLATVVLPDRFKVRFPEAVKLLSVNSHRLSTPFDIHKTLLDLLYRQNLPASIDTTDPQYADPPFLKNGFGFSLFTEIPVNRSCSTAGIPIEWCACSTLRVIPPTLAFAQRLGRIAVQNINKRVRNSTQCELLSIEKVLAVWEDVPATLDVDREYLFSDYVINFETSPGRGRFEARLRVRGSYDERMNPKSLTRVIGVISRLNMYKNDSYCVSNPMLKLYCYCSSKNRKVDASKQVPSEFHNVINLQSSLSQPKLSVQQVWTGSSGHATAPLLDTSKQRKLGTLFKQRTQFELRKQARSETSNPVDNAVKQRARYRIKLKPSQTHVPSTSELEANIIIPLEEPNLDLDVARSDIVDPADHNEDKSVLNGLDQNYVS